MSVVVEAERLATMIKTEGVFATVDVRLIKPPCVLVEPVPTRTYDPALCDDDGAAFTLTWRVVCLAGRPGDLAAARDLDRLADHVAARLSSEGLALASAVPGLYAVGVEPSSPQFAAMIITAEGGQTWRS